MIYVLVAIIAVLLILISAGFTYAVKSGKRNLLRRKNLPKNELSQKPSPSGNRTAVPRPGSAAAQAGGGGKPETFVGAESVSDEAEETEAEPLSGRPNLRERLSKTGGILASPLASLRSKGRIDQQIYDQLEEAMILADVGIPTTAKLLDSLRSAVKENRLSGDVSELADYLKKEIVTVLDVGDTDLVLTEEPGNVWLLVGVNGVGKTTTIGKLAHREVSAGKKVVLAAGDTFRAAAADQLELWAKRTGADFVKGAAGADPSSVIFDAVRHGAAQNADLVIADSAGRLHNKANLMEELKKVRRIAARPPGNLTEVLLVIDATTGQNGLIQARQFAEAVQVTGIVLTKLDGTAKGGIVLAIASELNIPIKLVGLGEGTEDLLPLDMAEFAETLIGISQDSI